MENFIHESSLKDLSLCDALIDYYNMAPKFDGRVGIGVNKDIKDSIDCTLQGELLNMYYNYLQKIADEYVEKFPFCNHYNPWNVTELVNIQKYEPNGGYKKWHTERSCEFAPQNARHLVFMTYLNDVTDGGGTEFYHQKLTVKAEKGKTVIWPADWTYTHRGVVSPTQEKYIVTGWFNYTPLLEFTTH